MSDSLTQQEECPARVGTVQPRIRHSWVAKNRLWRLLAYFDYWSSYFFFWFNTIAIIRLALESVAVIALVFAVVGVIGELQQREADRGVRIATLFSQIAETHALPEGKGLRALKASVEALAREGVPMHGLNLSGADLFKADLRGVDFYGADLSGAFLRGSNLSNASLDASKLTGADLYSANLSDADLYFADVSGAKLDGVIGLSEEQLGDACADPGNPPKLPQPYSDFQFASCDP